MAYLTLYDFAEIAEQVIGKLQLTPKARPYPWFCKDIYSPKELQWAGYIGESNSHKQALVFGINLEFTAAWKRVLPKIKGNRAYFSGLLGEHQDLEWHWMGRPGQLAKDPEIRRFQWIWTYQVDCEKWVNELEDILNQTKMWKSGVPMRPQTQVVRAIGIPNDESNRSLLKPKIQQTVLDLQPLVDFWGN